MLLSTKNMDAALEAHPVMRHFPTLLQRWKGQQARLLNLTNSHRKIYLKLAKNRYLDNQPHLSIAMIEPLHMTGPFDYHLTRRLMNLCQEFQIPYQRDVFKYYRSDIATALEAGYDIRSSLICFGIDGSHGYERIHWHSLESLIQLLIVYMQSPLLFGRDKAGMSGRHGFPTQPI